MKKLLSLVLICAMGFGMISCVESEESQSVRDIRDAKAEQLKALAELSRAQAQARIIEAEAEAAYDKAHAAYQQALADEKQNSIEQSKAKFAYEIEKIKAEYEAAMLKSMKEAKGYEQEILKMANDKIEHLYTVYSGYVANLNTANRNLLNKKIDLGRVEAALVDITEAANKEIEDNTALIEELEAKLAILTDNGYSQMDKDSLEAEYFKALAAYNDAKYNYQLNENAAYEKAKKAAEDAQTKYFEGYNAKENEMNALENGIIGVTVGDKEWLEQYDYVGHWFENQRFYGYKTISQDVDTDGDGTNDATVDVEVICSWDDPDWEGDYLDHNGNKVLQSYNVRTTIHDDGYRSIFEHLNVFVNEAPLLKFKTTSADSYKTAVDNLDEYTKDLETATAQETAVKGFEKAFADADAARKAIEAFNEAYEKYNEADETVKAKEDALVATKKDTIATGPYLTLINANAALDVLTNKDNEEYGKDGSLVKALADAKAALAALPTTATDAEKAAAEGNVTTAQKALDKAIYDAQVAIVNAKAGVKTYEDEVDEAADAIETAKENEAALLAANTAAQAAVETLKGLFGENGEFRAFMFDEDGLWTGPDGTSNYNFSNAVVNLLTDKNDDDNPDMVMDANGNKNGLYESETVTYPFFGSVDNGGNIVPFEDYAAEFTKFSAHYTKAVAVATDNVSKANKTIAELKDWVADWDGKEAELRAWVEAKNAEIAEVRAAYDEFTKAEEAKKAVEAAVAVLDAKADALYTMLNMNAEYDLTSKISAIERQIETAQKAITDAEDILANLVTTNSKYDNWDSSGETIAYREVLIERYKADIAAYEEEIEYYTQMVANAKAALDAELSAQNAE